MRVVRKGPEVFEITSTGAGNGKIHGEVSTDEKNRVFELQVLILWYFIIVLIGIYGTAAWLSYINRIQTMIADY